MAAPRLLTITLGLLVIGAWPRPAHAQTIREQQQWYLDEVELLDAHAVTRGGGVIVAVIDGGIDATHPDLAGALLSGASFYGSASVDGLTDPDGHGTSMAGLIAARGARGANSVLGMAPEALILSVAVPTDRLVPPFDEAVRWAVDNGAQVINMSMSKRELNADEWNAIADAQAHDVVFVISSGNNAETAFDNAFSFIPGVVVVSGIGDDGTFWTGSVIGPYVAISGPAQNVVSTGALNIHDTGFQIADGTSEAAAIVSGIAALIRSRYPELDAANVVNRLIRSAVDKGATGRDEMYGFGVVNARKAVTMTLPMVDENPLGTAKPISDAAGAPPDSDGGCAIAANGNNAFGGWFFAALVLLHRRRRVSSSRKAGDLR